MSLTTTQEVHASRRWLRGLWEYYREYTHTAIHTAAAAALTGFGLLIFVDPLFAALAIASYVFPPVILYVVDDGQGSVERAESDASRSTEGNARPTSGTRSKTGSGADADRVGGGDGDGDEGDTDSDSVDSDTDTDGRDADSDGTDADTDSDGYDADSDGADGDTDSDD